MYFGEYERTVDAKGRLTVPGHLLVASEEADWSKLVILKAESPCLYLYDIRGWRMLLRAADETMDDDERRLFMHRALADAQITDLDSLKRVTIPPSLLGHARIDKRVVVVGMFNRLELWQPDVWTRHLGDLADIALPSIEDLSRARIREVS